MTSRAIKKTACRCGSSDGNVLYDDGHSYCFVCKTHRAGTRAESPGRVEKVSGDLISHIEYMDLPKRRITEATCRKFGYGIGTHRDVRVQVAPYYDRHGSLVAQKVRKPGKKFEVVGDLSKALLFGQQLWKASPNVKVVVTEGELDALSFSQVQGNDWPVVSVPAGASGAAKALAGQIEWLLGFESVVLAFDSDKVGKEAAAECAQLFPPGRCRIARLALKDPNEYLVAGREKDLLKAFWEAQTYRPDGIIDSKEAWERLQQACLEESKAGRIPFRQPDLQQRLAGRRPGGVYVYCAGTGAGKSTEFREDSYHVMSLGEKVGYIALEETVDQTILAWLGIALNKPGYRAMLSEEEKKAAFSTIDGKFYLYEHFGAHDIAGLVSKIRHLAVAEGCRIIYLDHLTMAITGSEEDDRRATDRLMSELSSLAVSLKIVLMVVSHLSRVNKTNHEGGDEITLHSLRGSHAIGQYATAVVAIERDQQAPSEEGMDVSNIRVLKHRWGGGTGLADAMCYVHETGRYLPRSLVGFSETKKEVLESL